MHTMVLLLALAWIAQDPPPPPVEWGQLAHFRGVWEGHETGRAGVGVGHRTCELVLGDHFLFCDNTSTFEPQEANPTGEVHQDWNIFSYDRNRERFIARQFNIETFVNTFVMDTGASGGERLVFVSESSENAPEGLRARLTYRFDGPDHFEETFELAFPGQEFEEFLRNRWTRSSDRP
jgi:hypothetical protein